MSHHGSNSNNSNFNNLPLKDIREMNEAMLNKWPKHLKEQEENNFPNRKLNSEDEGEIHMSISVENNSAVVMKFQKTVGWVGFTAQQARDIAKSLILKANELDKIKNK